ncbi:hypothetical protein [Candidatus Uabimicrobium sp. HlEnr_7]|uniref:hypothetical protein n=1 Tax=Candidatus Uabimicrobium helgolandensis TaxID=3095367 RepID=UPI003556ADF8
MDFHIGVDIRIVDTTIEEVLSLILQMLNEQKQQVILDLVIAGISTRFNGSIEVDNENQ